MEEGWAVVVKQENIMIVVMDGEWREPWLRTGPISSGAGLNQFDWQFVLIPSRDITVAGLTSPKQIADKTDKPKLKSQKA